MKINKNSLQARINNLSKEKGVHANVETVIAEKLQIILARGILNSRCKDFYDIYIIRRLQWDNIDKEYLKKAFEETCGYRKTTFSKYSATEIIEQIASNSILRSRWANYAKKSSFARDVSLDATIHACRLVIETAVT